MSEYIQNIDRPRGGERAILVHINFPAGAMQEDLLEFEELASSAGAEIVATITGARTSPEAKFFVGTGKADEIKSSTIENKAELVIFNHALSPAQERNLERLLQCRVIDRTGLILDIFAQRARSFEGKLQVELALLKHMSTRLVRGWTHLERQRGGIGLRGPGETQLETDRRLIRGRIKSITQKLNKVRKQREQGRISRRKAIIPTVALVGYTNAGKSTLFNHLTNADAYVANRLFATLDPTLRRLDLPEVGPVILADTVGFIRHLPHDLIEAFFATLEEIVEADLLLHVVDVSDDRLDANLNQVQLVLKEIGADNLKQILVYNKSDLSQVSSFQEYDQKNAPNRVRVSAITGAGISQLKRQVIEMLGKDIVEKSVVISPQSIKLRAQFYALGAVISEKTLDNGDSLLVVRMPKHKLEKLLEGS